MKYLISEEQSVKEFNKSLKEGIKHGFILREGEIGFLKELKDNLVYYFTFFEEYEKRKK